MVTDFDTKVMNTVIKYACLLFNTSEDELISVKRVRQLTDGRAVCMAVMVSFTKMSLEVIAARFNRDHSTCIAAVKKVMDLRDTSQDFRARLKIILDYVNEECKSSFKLEDIMDRKSTMPEDNELFEMVCARDKKIQLLSKDYNDSFTLLLAKEIRAIQSNIDERLNYLNNQ
jgi:hypothetical protein